MRNARSFDQDSYQATQGTWIIARYAEGDDGRRDVCRYLMEEYHSFLVGLYRKRRGAGDVDDAIAGFWERSLRKEGAFVAAWRASGKRLRTFLATRFFYHLKDLARESRRRKQVPLPDGQESPASEEHLDAELDRLFVQCKVERATRATREACEAKGLGVHFEIFCRHWFDQESFPTIAARYGVSRERAEVMSRTVFSHWERHFWEALERDGASRGEIRSEIKGLLEALR
jgi:hypothetical protein